jgi:hypothetical protein
MCDSSPAISPHVLHARQVSSAAQETRLARYRRKKRGKVGNARSSPAQHSPRLIHHISLHPPSLRSLSHALRMSKQLATAPVNTPIKTTTNQGFAPSHSLSTTPCSPCTVARRATRCRSRAYSRVQSIEERGGGFGEGVPGAWGKLGEVKRCLGKEGKRSRGPWSGV